jgi:hypothetical protein
MKQAPKYQFEPINWFDARKGYKRIGSQISIAGELNGTHAKLWRSRAGELVARLTCRDNRYCFIVKGRNASHLDEEMDDVEDALARLLGSWLADGTDDWPEM